VRRALREDATSWPRTSSRRPLSLGPWGADASGAAHVCFRCCHASNGHRGGGALQNTQFIRNARRRGWTLPVPAPFPAPFPPLPPPLPLSPTPIPHHMHAPHACTSPRLRLPHRSHTWSLATSCCCTFAAQPRPPHVSLQHSAACLLYLFRPALRPTLNPSHTLSSLYARPLPMPATPAIVLSPP
jgi:hypothetical protein